MGSFLQSFENAKYGSAAPHGELLVARIEKIMYRGGNWLKAVTRVPR